MANRFPSTVGLDFDNTLISYDEVMTRLAVERGLLSPDRPLVKKQIRDAIRLQPDGEKQWQLLQAEVYGPRIAEGRLPEGARQFLEECRRRSIRILVISHKTRYATLGDGRTDLRESARGWMRAQGFFDPRQAAVAEEDVHFASTRQEKVDRIGKTGCGAFVDDLEETFLEPGFPVGIRKVLYGANHWPGGPGDVECAATWNEIASILLDGRDFRPAC